MICLDYNIEEQFTDGTGWIIVAKIKIECIIYIVCNAYAPTRDHRSDQIEFIKNIQSTLAPYEHENILLGGDFNLYLDPKLDKADFMSNKSDNPVYRKEMFALRESVILTYAWRDLNPNSRRYTWHSRRQACLLAHFWTSS